MDRAGCGDVLSTNGTNDTHAGDNQQQLADESAVGEHLEVLVVGEVGEVPVGGVEIEELVGPDADDRRRSPLVERGGPFVAA